MLLLDFVLSSLLIFIAQASAAPVNATADLALTFDGPAWWQPATAKVHRRSDSIDVCGADMRPSNLQDKCKNTPLQFSYDGSTLTPHTTNGNAGPIDRNARCDHALELQFVKKIVEGSGACTTLNRIAAAVKMQSGFAEFKKQTFSKLIAAVNSQTNLVYLPEAVNQEKAQVVSAFISSVGQIQRPASAALTAVKTYYAHPVITQNTRALATNLDGLLREAITKDANASIARQGLYPPWGKTASSKRGRPDPRNVVAGLIETWEDGLGPDDSIAGQWQRFLNELPHM